MRRIVIVTFMCLLVLPTSELFSIDKKELLHKVRKYRQANEHGIIKEFLELLSIPNVAADKTNIRKNAVHIVNMFKKRGVDSRVLETDGNPIVYGEVNVPGATRTLLIYVHYDGQPVDPSHWSGTHPFKPELRPGKLKKAGTNDPKPIPFPKAGQPFNENWRLYCRSASDDKAPLIGITTALDAMKHAGIPLKNNLKFIFEGEEEAGSPNLGAFLKKHKDLLKADVLLMCDGPAYFSGATTLFFGVRGVTTVEIEVYGAYASLHSGHYGNWAPNPGMLLSQLLASMKDAKGNVLVKGFYDTVTPLSPLEIKTIKTIPGYEEQLKKQYGFHTEENPDLSLMEAIQRPSLNIGGLRSGWVGSQARTIIPPDAEAAIDIRLVKGNDPNDLVEKVRQHIKKQGYHVIDREPTVNERETYPKLARVFKKESGYRASRTSMDLPVSRAIKNMLTGYHDVNPVLLPSLGGSLPIYLFEETLGIPIIGVSVANYDNNQHQPDENIRIGHLWKGIETFAAIMIME